MTTIAVVCWIWGAITFADIEIEVELPVTTFKAQTFESFSIVSQEDHDSLMRFFNAESLIPTIEELRKLLPEKKNVKLSELHEMAKLARDHLWKNELFHSIISETMKENSQIVDFKPLIEPSTNRVNFIRSKLLSIEKEIARRENMIGTNQESLLERKARIQREARAITRNALMKSMGGALPIPMIEKMYLMELRKSYQDGN